MKFELSQKDFSEALTLSGKSLLTKSNLPILSNLLINVSGSEVEILSTNLETATKVKITCKVEGEGKATLNGKTLWEFVSQLPEGNVVFETLGEEALVSTEGYKARLATISPEEFPAIPKIGRGISIKINGGKLVEAISKVAFCAAADEARPILTGVLCSIEKNKLKLVATDGYRLSYDEVDVEAPKDAVLKIIVPARALMEVGKIIVEKGGMDRKDEVTLLVADSLNQVDFKVGNVDFTSRLIEGEYPGWQKVIPAAFSSKAKVSKEEFTKIVRVASIFARDAGSIIRLKLEPGEKSSNLGKLTVLAVANQLGSTDAKADVELTGPGGEIAFNFRYLLEVLSVIDGDEVYFEMLESLNPGKITSLDSEDKFFHVIMPVRLQS